MAVLFAPIVIAAALAALYIAVPQTYLDLISEDSHIEDLQTVTFAAAGAMGLIAAWFALRASAKLVTVLLALFAIGCIVIAGEEVSWGQRFFGFETPESIAQRNKQNELTFHNLDGIQELTAVAYYVVCGFACFAWIFIRNRDIPNRDVRRFVIPDWPTVTYFAPIALFYLLHDGLLYRGYILSPLVESWRHQESFELLFALGVAVVAFRNLRRARALDAPEPAVTT